MPASGTMVWRKCDENFFKLFLMVFMTIPLICQLRVCPAAKHKPEDPSEQFCVAKRSPPFPEVSGEVVYVPFPIKISVDGGLSDWAKYRLFVDRGPCPQRPAENGRLRFRCRG